MTISTASAGDPLMNSSTSSPNGNPESISRREWLLLVLICLVGAGLRCWRSERLSIEHFDEGVYAANLYAVLDDNCYPSRHLYAPPLFPLLCEFAIGLGATPDASIWVNLLFGSLMVPLVWLVARDLVGPVVAVTSSILCATSEYHILFSRSALTDVPLCFWLLLAVWLTIRGMQSGNGVALGGAAVSAALGWWTKYNGWLAIAIPLGGWCVANGVMHFRKWCQAGSSSIEGGNKSDQNLLGLEWSGLMRWLLVAVLTVLLWAPVVYDLRTVGGYSAVSANHSKYLTGWAGWWSGLQMHGAYQGWLTTWLGVGLTCVLMMWMLPGRRARTWLIVWVGLVCTIVSKAVGFTLALTSLVVVGHFLRCWLKRQVSLPGSSMFAEAVFFVWWIGLTLTTPLYTPYARLSLPWLVSCWVLVGYGVSIAMTSLELRKQTVGRVVAFLTVGLVAASVLGRPRENSIDHIWGERTSLRHSAIQILHEMEMSRREMPPSESPDCDYAIYVVGEPALFCHLTQLSDEKVITKPASRVMEAAAPHHSGPGFPKFLVTGPHVPESEVHEGVAAGLIEPIWEQQVLVSDLVSLDSTSRENLQSHSNSRQAVPRPRIPVRVFRILE